MKQGGGSRLRSEGLKRITAAEKRERETPGRNLRGKGVQTLTLK